MSAVGQEGINPELRPALPRTIQLAEELRRLSDDLWKVHDLVDTLYDRLDLIRDKLARIRKDYMVTQQDES